MYCELYDVYGAILHSIIDTIVYCALCTVNSIQCTVPVHALLTAQSQSVNSCVMGVQDYDVRSEMCTLYSVHPYAKVYQLSIDLPKYPTYRVAESKEPRNPVPNF